MTLPGVRPCSGCDEGIPPGARGRKYCSAECRIAADLRRRRKLRRDNPDEFRARDRARYWGDVERRREYARHRYHLDPESSLKRNAAWRANDPEGRREYNRRYYRENKPRFYEAARRREIAVANATVVRFSAEQLAERLSMFPGCWICGDRADVMHIDHVKPLSKGGPHMLSNLRPACAPCNLSKAAQWPFVPINAGWQNVGT